MLLRHWGRSLIAHAPAKLNLFLEVLGKRADGYHELETVLVSVDLYDTLSFKEGLSHDIQLRCFDAGSRCGVGGEDRQEIPTGRDNLVVKAASLLRQYSGVERGVQVELWKRIPAAAGLAGGSSDGAATLAALNRLWELHLSHEELLQLASQLGSDVSFFLAPSPAAICRGRGEQIVPFRLAANLHFVIARPKTGLATSLVYRHCQPTADPRTSDKLVHFLTAGPSGSVGRYLYNALSLPAEQLNTEISELRKVFSEQPVLGHAMSGSGTAYFGLCATSRQARTIAARLTAMRLGRVFVAQSRS